MQVQSPPKQLPESHPSSNGQDEDGFSTASSTHRQADDDHQEGAAAPAESNLAKRESQHVMISRLFVFLVLVLSCLGVSLAVYFYLTAVQHNEFVKQFESDATKVLDSLGQVLDHTLGSADAFVVNMVAFARYSNATWPFVTLPDFNLQATKLLRVSKAVQVGTRYIVRPELRDEWEAYADRNGRTWVDDGVQMQARDADYHGPIIWDYNVSYSIYGFTGNKTEPNPLYGSYLPLWHQAPVVPTSAFGFPYNWDGWEVPLSSATIDHAFKTRRAAITPYTNVYDVTDPQGAQQAAAAQAWMKQYIAPHESPNEPSDFLIYPIINSAKDVRVDASSVSPEDLDEELPVVGALTFTMRWVTMIRDLLPVTSKGVILAFHQSKCGDAVTDLTTFTYQLNGAEAVFLGNGDLHESKFDQLVHSAKLADLMGVPASSLNQTDEHATANEKSSPYTGLPLSDEYCPKTLKIYPSTEMESRFKTTAPAWVAVAAALIFVFTSLVFVLYDLLVARRQRIVMQRAIASGTIVSSLFPDNVKQKLYQEQKQEQEMQTKQQKFLNVSFQDSSTSRQSLQQSHGSMNDAPNYIADHYKDTTVLLADIAGFTAWGAGRTPAQVFELLETLYGAFDEIAKRRAVFKIETIGDCYVAVTGLPRAQQDHAMRMAKFANACMTEMDRITHSLAVRLGSETETLQLRVGMNSGDITAGVLRGAKARFQLFGDTINTASRMESSGEPGRIHVSQSTANEIANAGKSHWITPREDKIVAKGKGEMQTYWIALRGGWEAMSGTALSFTTSPGARSARSLATADEGGEGTIRDMDVAAGDFRASAASMTDEVGAEATNPKQSVDEHDDIATLEEKLFQRLEC